MTGCARLSDPLNPYVQVPREAAPEKYTSLKYAAKLAEQQSWNCWKDGRGKVQEKKKKKVLTHGFKCSAKGTRPVKCIFRVSFSHFRRSPRRPYARARDESGLRSQ